MTNHHVIIPLPGAPADECARVERTTRLVEAFLRAPAARGLDETMCSLSIHVLSGWLGMTRGQDAAWEALEPGRFVDELPGIAFMPAPALPLMREALLGFLRWMAATGRMEQAAATRCIGELLEAWSRLAFARGPGHLADEVPPARARRRINRIRRHHRN